MKGKADKELAAIGAILGALEGLDGESIQRVLEYNLVVHGLPRGDGKPGQVSKRPSKKRRPQIRAMTG